MTTDVLDVIEAAYRVDLADGDWLDGVLRAACTSLDGGFGVTGYFVDLSDGGFRAWQHACVGRDPATDRANFESWRVATPVALQRYSHLARPSGLVTEIPPPRGESLDPLLEASGFEQVFGVSALDATGRGCALSAPRTRDATVPDRITWDRVAAHLATALRLRRRLGSGPREELVVSDSGRVVHAEGEAAAARDALRAAAIRIDAARTRRARRNQRAATAMWAALVEAKWSVVDRFDRDGRRYYVAWRNEPRPEAHELTPREAQVAAACGLGHSNKLIAYELGISESTVARCLAAAAKKLGAASRVELVKLAAALVGKRQ